MIQINVSTIIFSPIQQVFDFVSQPENDFQWQYGTLETTKLSEGANNSGTFFQSTGHLLGRRNVSTFEIAEYEPSTRYKIKSLSGPLQSHTSYTFETVNNATKIKVSMLASVVDVHQINENLLEKSLIRQLKENLALLKNLLEEKF